ncbi:hypothetical protein E2C01_017105 [Portunus trituberculatus]|uniref:Uncharacterized protein n=1 Tax=Portunus trituberculatus TaxID=210409 RepID=A0A5B7DS18_PORTR|nr:hypothetical protein [Portunus trituberculatus]
MGVYDSALIGAPVRREGKKEKNGTSFLIIETTMQNDKSPYYATQCKKLKRPHLSAGSREIRRVSQN